MRFTENAELMATITSYCALHDWSLLQTDYQGALLLVLRKIRPDGTEGVFDITQTEDGLGINVFAACTFPYRVVGKNIADLTTPVEDGAVDSMLDCAWRWILDQADPDDASLPEVENWVRQLTSDQNEAVRITAAGIVSEFHDPVAIQALKQAAVQDDSSRVRLMALNSLLQQFEDGVIGRDDLAAVLNHLRNSNFESAPDSVRKITKALAR